MTSWLTKYREILHNEKNRIPLELSKYTQNTDTFPQTIPQISQAISQAIPQAIPQAMDEAISEIPQVEAIPEIPQAEAIPEIPQVEAIPETILAPLTPLSALLAIPEAVHPETAPNIGSVQLIKYRKYNINNRPFTR